MCFRTLLLLFETFLQLFLNVQSNRSLAAFLGSERSILSVTEPYVELPEVSGLTLILNTRCGVQYMVFILFDAC